MIQIEMITIDEKDTGQQPLSSTHACRVTEGEKTLGELFLSMTPSHGRLVRALMEEKGEEYLDGLVKTAIHQMFWKGVRTISYEKSDSLLKEYFGKYDLNQREEGGEIHFEIEDFIQATRCSHG